MIENIDTSLIDWSRAQFALTAMYHWLFVPLTLGLGVIQAIMETIYYRTGNEAWKKTAQFWMKLFGINFAIGVATGLILEFEFGTNWSNYSWFVGDIFGAPLAIEGILAFFMEATFIAVMFFGWDKVSKRFHLASTWLTIIGATLSALWILIANAWMQYPVGMHFNPDTVRNEMFDFWAVALSPVAINKFFHTVLSGWIVGALFVLGISCWYLLKKRNTEFALSSIKVSAIFGLVASILIIWTGDGSAYQVAQKQPMKLAAMEGLYEGGNGVGLVGIGILNPAKTSYLDNQNAFIFDIKFPKLLSFLAERDINAYVPGIVNLKFVDVNGDGVINEDDKTEVGNPHPDITMGLSFNVGYKGFDLAVTTYGAFGQQNMRSYRKFTDGNVENYTSEVFEYWHGEGTSNRYPRLVPGNTGVNFQQISDIFVEDASYFRIQNVTLGYDFKNLWKNCPLPQLRLYVSAQNLFTFTGYKGMDPEIGTNDSYREDNPWARGIDLGSYPSPRTYMVGVNIKF